MGPTHRMTYVTCLASIYMSLMSIIFGMLCLWSIVGVQATRLKVSPPPYLPPSSTHMLNVQKRRRSSQRKLLYFTTSTRRRRSSEARRRYRSLLRWERGCGWNKIGGRRLVCLWSCLALHLWGMPGLVLCLARRIGRMSSNLVLHLKFGIDFRYLLLDVLSLYLISYRYV